MPCKLRLQFSVSKSNNSKALLSVFFQDTLKVNRNLKRKVEFRVIKISHFTAELHREKNISLSLTRFWLTQAGNHFRGTFHISIHSLLPESFCYHTHTLQNWRKWKLAHNSNLVTGLCNMGQKQKKVTYINAEKNKKRGRCLTEKHTYWKLKQFLKKRKRKIFIVNILKYFSRYKIFKHKPVNESIQHSQYSWTASVMDFIKVEYEYTASI